MLRSHGEVTSRRALPSRRSRGCRWTTTSSCRTSRRTVAASSGRSSGGTRPRRRTSRRSGRSSRWTAPGRSRSSRAGWKTKWPPTVKKTNSFINFTVEFVSAHPYNWFGPGWKWTHWIFFWGQKQSSLARGPILKLEVLKPVVAHLWDKTSVRHVSHDPKLVWSIFFAYLMRHEMRSLSPKSKICKFILGDY